MIWNLVYFFSFFLLLPVKQPLDQLFNSQYRIKLYLDLPNQIFCLFRTTLKDLLQLGQSNSPIVNSVLFPALSGRPAIFQLFRGLATSAPQFLHFTIHLLLHQISYLFLNMMNKRFAIQYKR